MALARVAERRLGDFIAQGLANTAWAFATAGQLDAQLFTALARVPAFSVVWATSTCACGACPLFFYFFFDSSKQIDF